MDLEVALVEHAELEQRDRLGVDGDDRGAAVARGVRGGRTDVDLLVQAVETGVGAFADHLVHRAPDSRGGRRGIGEAGDRRRRHRRQLGVGQDAVADVGGELRHDVVGAGLGGVDHPGPAVVDAARALHHQHRRHAGADQRGQQHQEDQRRLQREATPVQLPLHHWETLFRLGRYDGDAQVAPVGELGLQVSRRSHDAT